MTGSSDLPPPGVTAARISVTSDASPAARALGYGGDLGLMSTKGPWRG